MGQQRSEELESDLVDWTADDVEDKATAAAELSVAPVKEKATSREQVQRGALRSALEAGEKERETQRSKEQWIKSRHQVLEEESVSAILKDNAIGMLEVATGQAKTSDVQQGSGGLALVNQLRAHQQIAAFLQASKETAPPGTSTPMDLLLAQKVAMSTGTSRLAVPAQMLPATTTAAGAEKQIKPSVGGHSVPKIALPPAHSMVNKLYPFSETMPLLFYPQPPAGFLPIPPWQPQLHSALPARTVVLTRPPGTLSRHCVAALDTRTDCCAYVCESPSSIAKKPEFKRMCESCRKRHFSVRQCRLVLQHTDPEWQPANPPADRRRRRK